MSPTRREFLAGALAAAGTVAVTGCSDDDGSGKASHRPTRGKGEGRKPASDSKLAPVRDPGDPAASGIDHIVVLMMENRSFDHFLGWLDGADGKQAGLSFPGVDGTPVATHRLQDWQGCDHPDPDHSFEGGRKQLNGGACDGFAQGRNDEFAVGYYTDEDLPFTSAVVQEFCTFDRYFAATMAETYPNRFFQHAAQTDRIHNSFAIATMPTIWDRLAAKRVSARYYFHDAPFIALCGGGKHGEISKPFDQFLADAEQGTLPAVSFVDPKFLNEGTGTSIDDHPHADVRAGQWFQNAVYEAITNGKKWERTLLVVNYDEWGGFYDHVVPTEAPDATPKQGTGLRGFRVPSYMVGPHVRRGTIGHEVYDHTSILKMIEWRHDLAPLTARDKAARNMAEVLDLQGKPNTEAPRWKVPGVDVFACNDPKRPAETADDGTSGGSSGGAGRGTSGGGGGASAGTDDGYAEWRKLRELADLLGFPASVSPF